MSKIKAPSLIRNVFFIAVISIAIIRCQNTTKTDSSRQFTNIQLKQDWAALADMQGDLGTLCDSAVVESAEFSENEKYICTGSALGMEMIVWDAISGEKLFEYDFPSKLEIVTFSRDNKYVLAGGEFNFLSIWNADSWSHNRDINLPSGIEGMCFSNEGDYLAVGREDGMIMLYETGKFTLIDSLLHGLHGSAPIYSDAEYRADVNSLDFSPDDRYLVSGGFDGDIKIWYLPERKLIKTISAHESSIKSVRINLKGNCIASASSGLPYEGDNSIKIWDFNSGNLLHKLSSSLGMEGVEFTPSGEFLLGGAQEFAKNSNDSIPNGFIYVYYIPEDFLNEPIRLVNKIPVLLAEYFCFNASGLKLVSGHEDGSVRVWDVIRE